MPVAHQQSLGLRAGDDLRPLKSAGGGDPEIIVEYRLTDVSLAGRSQTAYESQEALPTNPLTTFHGPRSVTSMGAPRERPAGRRAAPRRRRRHPRGPAGAAGGRRPRRAGADFEKFLSETPGDEGWEPLRVEVATHSRASVRLLEGSSPGEEQIALSLANAERFGLSSGESMLLRRSGGTAQDVVIGGADPAALAAEGEEDVPSSTVVLLITSLFLRLRLRLARERPRRGVLTAIGSSAREIASRVRLKVALSVVAGYVGALALTARPDAPDKSAWLRGRAAPTARRPPMRTTTVTLQARALTKACCSTGPPTTVLHGIGLSVASGDFAVIMGASGSGRSMMLCTMSGMDRPTSGSVHLEGRDLTTLDDTAMSRVRLSAWGSCSSSAASSRTSPSATTSCCRR